MEKKVIEFYNCHMDKVLIHYSHHWIIKDYGEWMKKNNGQWLADQPFSPVQGEQLQFKIFVKNCFKTRIVLKNCGQKPTTIKEYSTNLENETYEREGGKGTVINDVTQGGGETANLDLNFHRLGTEYVVHFVTGY